MLLALELADAGLIALPSEGEVGAPSPGVAVIDGDTIDTGRTAAARSRTTPRRVHNRFWSEISTEVIGGVFGDELRTADLAWTHLHRLWKEIGHGVTSVILVLPAGADERRAGLILGVARSAGLPVDGLVEAPVAAAAGRSDDGHAVHLDLELHRATATVLAPGPRRTQVRISADLGLSSLERVWLAWIAGIFLTTTRFDPLHSAETEQALFDQLPSILARLATRGSTSVSLTSGDKVFSVDLSRDAAIAVTADLTNGLETLAADTTSSATSKLLLSSRAALIPGVTQRLAEVTGLEVVTLPLAAAAAGSLDHADRIRAPGPSLPLITDLGPAGS